MHPDSIGPYRILGPLREGGVTSVYKAAGPAGAVVALKVFSPHVLDAMSARSAGQSPGGGRTGAPAGGDAAPARRASAAAWVPPGAAAGESREAPQVAETAAAPEAWEPPKTPETPEIIARFHREVRAVVPLSHPNILQVLGTGQDGDHLYLATELFNGHSLERLLKERRLTIPQAIAVLRGLCRGLAYAHARGFVHGHLSPRHLLVSPDLAAVKIADFGPSEIDVVSELDSTLRTGAYALGSFHYLAPEQVTKRGAPPDPRSDLYAAGVIFYELLTGRPPGGKFSLPSHANAELPPATDELVLKCLARDPEQRYPSANALLADLARLEEALRVRLLSHLRGASRLLGAPGSARRSLLLAALALLLAALALAGYFLAR
jgi:serine/threonine protein kinase